MKDCLSSISLAIILYGTAQEWFQGTRVIRQGDPFISIPFSLGSGWFEYNTDKGIKKIGN